MSTVSAACAWNTGASPHTVLESYAAALEAGELTEAYEQLSSDTKKTINFKEFKRIVRENPEEIREIVRALRRRATPARVTAMVTAPSGEELLLVYEAGGWRVDGSAIDLYSQATPEAALRSFLRALQNHRYDVLLLLMPEGERKGTTEAQLRSAWEGEQKQELLRMAESLKEGLPSARFELLGDRATMSYGARGTVEFLREHGVWKIEDVR